ncbi:MAG: polyphosphate polymerase domain-containing protein [Candidatus Latescibacteria bacterium]|nr:polyphosphate polymerase domain-containing protein [Candidatus Latescibacterota bacterium]
MRAGIPEDARLEIKFTAYETEIPRLTQWLHLHKSGFGTPYPPRWINNVYFDSHEYFAYAENLFGSSNRTKVRYRWYGDYTDLQTGELEIKCKRNCFSWKQHFPITLDPSLAGASWREIRRCIMDQLPADGALWMDTHPQPVITNRYHRQYFVSADGRVRATIDSRQATYDQRYKPYPNTTRSGRPPGTTVLEFKFDRSDRSLASGIIQGLPLRVGRHSKYMMGVHAIHGY